MEEQFRNYADLSLSKTAPENTYFIHGVRISVLTDFLLRVEVQQSSVFCDVPTQSVVNRSFGTAEFSVTQKNGELTVKTKATVFCFSLKEKKMKYIKLADGRNVTNFYQGNLKGTCRTLDGTDGETKLKDGIISKNGVAVLDDSNSLVICADGKILPRKCRSEDKYYFAYGYDYIRAVQDFFMLTGMPPLIPRYALGNWWSRYKAYTQDEYIALIIRFMNEQIPLTVATIDMDWHWVKVVKKFGKDSIEKVAPKNILELFYNTVSPGWTGYSWNTELFPQPRQFLEFLKSCNLKITMNLHPASGCKFYEDAYKDFAEYMGIDSASKQQILFDITDEKFLNGYFKFLHHPHEKDGVDFWWIDWQQGSKTKTEGLDPLWALNHYHTLDIARNNKRPLILSRYAGPGSHRYPLGFSGDTAQSWATLDFQPYFTATASNIGYTWWSHDIGGHHFGARDDELYLRWVQYGIFSPIMRLHSTSNEFMGKEPWKYRSYVYKAAAEAMRLRHRMLPYIYTMNYRTAVHGRALTEPMYYENPQDERAYNCPNEYRFGSELIVCPITRPVNTTFNLAPVKVYLPKGRYTDIFSDRIYTGDGEFELFRDEGSIPVLAKEGAIIPLSLSAENNSCKNPDALELLIFRGNSSFTLYEDDGESLAYKNGAYAQTKYSVSQLEDNVCFSVEKAEGDLSLIPSEREYLFNFRDILDAKDIEILINGKLINDAVINKKHDSLTISLKRLSSEHSLKIKLSGIKKRVSPDKKELKIEAVSKAQQKNFPKTLKYNHLLKKDGADAGNCLLNRILKEFEHLYYE